MAPALRQHDIDPYIWNACAGLSVQNHFAGSRVYYFPQGHAEHSSSPLDLTSVVNLKHMVHCRVVSVRLLSNLDTDEVYSKISLEPVDVSSVSPLSLVRPPFPAFSSGLDEEERKIVSFAKILTPSDANNGGGFSVPRYCADSIFPKLNYEADPPVQTISVTDCHGVVWEFRHIFRGTPRRHLLTTGWSKFVNYKKLVAGDSVVFMKTKYGELFVGIRRATRSSCSTSTAAVEAAKWCPQMKVETKEKEEDDGYYDGFSRSSKGRVSAESVLKATELAGDGKPFEIVFYPNAGSPDFVVKAEKVESALSVNWTAGMRFKLGMESEDSSRMTAYYGTVSTTSYLNQGPFRGSPWRMLQVTWDDAELLKNMNNVSPWLVDVVEATPPLHTPFPPSKKLRSSHNSELLPDGEGPPFFPMTGFTNSMMGHLSSSLFDPKTFPVGMQGARQNIGLSGYPDFLGNDTHQMYADHLYGNVVSQLSSVSTELNIGTASQNIGTASQSDNSSPHSQGSVNFFGKERLGNQNCSPVKKAATSSFQLFGKIIETNQPIDTEHGTGGCAEDDGSKGYKETENLLDPTPFPYEKLRNRLDVQCQTVTAVEACTQ